jgi:hypothetical protein
VLAAVQDTSTVYDFTKRERPFHQYVSWAPNASTGSADDHRSLCITGYWNY